MTRKFAPDSWKTLGVRRGALIASAAAAVAASAWELEHRRVRRADLTEAHLRVEKLSDLGHDGEALETIERGLVEEWGDFAFLGFESLREMLAKAGDTILVVLERDETGTKARGIVQTILTDVHGDAELLQDTYPDFASLTSWESWKRSRSKGGDTAVLLQITTLGPTERGGGLGSLLRNAALNMFDTRVSYALTTTPVDGSTLAEIDVEDPKTYTAAMRFHARGGANPARILPGYKTASGDGVSKHGADIVVMRYARDESGEWPAPRPAMRLRSMGPVQLRIARATRRLRLRRRLRGLKPPRPSFRSLRGPGVRLARLRRGKQVFAGIRSRFTRRGGEEPALPAA
jgi:hypothetical protein